MMQRLTLAGNLEDLDRAKLRRNPRHTDFLKLS